MFCYGAFAVLFALYWVVMLAVGFNLRMTYEVMLRIDNPSDYNCENKISQLCGLLKALRKLIRSLLVLAFLCFALLLALIIFCFESGP